MPRTIWDLRGLFQKLKIPGLQTTGPQGGARLAQESANISHSVASLPFFSLGEAAEAGLPGYPQQGLVPPVPPDEADDPRRG